jgi:hypothetical protein
VSDQDDKPKFVGNRPRSERVELLDHVEFRGKVYTALIVRRLSTSQVAKWLEDVEAQVPDANLGNVVDDDGEVVPQQVLDAIDDDDDFRVSEVLNRFLPERLSEMLGSGSKTPTTSSS